MKKFLIPVLFITYLQSTNAQIVNIPDVNFKKALLEHFIPIDINNDKEIQVIEAQSTYIVSVNRKSISDLTGIEAFTSLEELSCAENFLTTINISNNTNLYDFLCSLNQLKSLDLSKNLKLKYLQCDQNYITSLDLSKNIELTEIYCAENQLTTLDLATNTKLGWLDCPQNLLKNLDVSNNDSMWRIRCTENVNLTEICITNQQESKIDRFWLKDPSASWNTSCGLLTDIKEVIYDNASKSIVRIVTPFGQEIRPEKAKDGVFIYQYDDGSTRKFLK